jgi:hypothetical protein
MKLSLHYVRVAAQGAVEVIDKIILSVSGLLVVNMSSPRFKAGASFLIRKLVATIF